MLSAADAHRIAPGHGELFAHVPVLLAGVGRGGFSFSTGLSPYDGPVALGGHFGLPLGLDLSVRLGGSLQSQTLGLQLAAPVFSANRWMADWLVGIGGSLEHGPSNICNGKANFIGGFGCKGDSVNATYFYLSLAPSLGTRVQWVATPWLTLVNMVRVSGARTIIIAWMPGRPENTAFYGETIFAAVVRPSPQLRLGAGLGLTVRLEGRDQKDDIGSVGVGYATLSSAWEF